MDVNSDGGGSVSVNDEKYNVVGNHETSGGAFCTRIFNDNSVVVECLLPWTGSLDDFPTVSEDDVEECFSEESSM
ncbi:hypothetical protein IMZ48_06755 [Candidatus Bathyarchaeota archaeon]|nr:hypothetical protein [Candidatus Bathyarchaeota archaeon]